MFSLNTTDQAGRTGLKLILPLFTLCLFWTGCDLLDPDTRTDTRVAPPPSSITLTARQTVPIEVGLYAACANNGVGEMLQISGELEVALAPATVGTHRRIVVWPINVRAEGQQSGEVFRSFPEAEDILPFPQSPLAFGYSVELYGQQTDVDLQFIQPLHIESSAEGELEVSSVSPSFEGCSSGGKRSSLQ